MAIHVVCGHCNNRCALPDSMRGKRVNCPACGHPLTIPGGVKGKATPPPLEAGSLLDLADSELTASRATPLAPAPSHRKRAAPMGLWVILGGLSLLLIIIIFAAMLTNGFTPEAPRETPPANVTTEKP